MVMQCMWISVSAKPGPSSINENVRYLEIVDLTLSVTERSKQRVREISIYVERTVWPGLPAGAVVPTVYLNQWLR